MNFKSDIGYRKKALHKLRDNILTFESQIIAALREDFGKPAFEAVLSETGLVLSELKTVIKKMEGWAKPTKVWPSLLNFPSRDRIYKEPYGKVLVIAPWNYPFQLAMSPLIAAVAAGNAVTLKPSELTPKTAALISEIIQLSFDPEHVNVVLGGADITQHLLEQRWDYIFFTGSVPVGKIIAQAAAKQLTPVTLELGGKNPCIIDPSAKLELAAKRICWGKFLNAGQTCIAPDYILIQNKVKAKFIECLKAEITAAYGESPELSPDFARIISDKNFVRISEMLDSGEIVAGGQTNLDQLYFSPTLLDEPALDSTVMQAEIFGPILPIISYENELEIETIISRYEKPLSLYVFSTNKKFIKKMISQFSFGGGCVNDTVVHFGNPRLPFGGVGNSGMGAYHGKRSFDTFSHHKAVVFKGNWLDIPMRYAPYKNKLRTIKKFLNWF